MKRTFAAFLLVLSFVPLCWAVPPGSLTLSLDAEASAATSPITLTAHDGIGPAGSLEYRASDLLALGITGGMIEFIAPPTIQDMKSVWLDLGAWFYPLPASPLGEVYLQAGFGVSPHLGLFPDYFPNYSSQVYGEKFYKVPPGTIFWDAQASLGYRFTLDKAWALDLGFQWDHFWPPEDRPLDTFGLRLGMAYSFEVGKF